jgi:Protein of unknown function (DUF1552)
MSKLQRDRRLFLKQLGVGAGALVFNPFLNRLFLEAHAQAASPQKLILFYMNAQPRWTNPAGEFLPKGTNFNIQHGSNYANLSAVPLTKMVAGDWPTLLAPMAPFFQNSLIVEGVFHGAQAGAGEIQHGMRYAGLNGICGQVNSTVVNADQNIPHGPTIDQIIAGGPSGQGVTHSSLLVGLANSDYSWEKNYTEENLACFASGANSPIPYLSRTRALERKLFGQDFIDGKSATATEAALRTARRTRVMDVLKTDILNLEKNLSSEYKDKLNVLLSSLDTYDKKKIAEASISCKPTAPSKLAAGSAPEDELLGLVDGATLALQCGLTNVVGIASGVERKHSTDIAFRNNVDAKVNDRWFEGTVSPSGTSPFYNPDWHYHMTNDGWKEGNQRILTFYVNILARMLENLSGKRGEMPPNTTVILLSDRGMSSAGHHHGFNGTNGRQPIFIWSTNPALKAQANYIRYPTYSKYGAWKNFEALSDFYRTFAMAFGVNLPSFGVYGGRVLNEILS